MLQSLNKVFTYLLGSLNFRGRFEPTFSLFDTVSGLAIRQSLQFVHKKAVAVKDFDVAFAETRSVRPGKTDHALDFALFLSGMPSVEPARSMCAAVFFFWY